MNGSSGPRTVSGQAIWVLETSTPGRTKIAIGDLGRRRWAKPELANTGASQRRWRIWAANASAGKTSFQSLVQTPPTVAGGVASKCLSALPSGAGLNRRLIGRRLPRYSNWSNELASRYLLESVLACQPGESGLETPHNLRISPPRRFETTAQGADEFRLTDGETAPRAGVLPSRPTLYCTHAAIV